MLLFPNKEFPELLFTLFPNNVPLLEFPNKELVFLFELLLLLLALPKSPPVV